MSRGSQLPGSLWPLQSEWRGSVTTFYEAGTARLMKGAFAFTTPSKAP